MMTITAYNNVMNGASIPLQNNSFTVVVKLRVPNTGNFVIFGKVNLDNLAATPQGLVAYLTTNDGAMVLDTAQISVSGNSGACMVLQGVLNLSRTDENEIVDIRCAAVNGSANWASLIAIPVDTLSGSLGS
jgi:hypothetical protein